MEAQPSVVHRATGGVSPLLAEKKRRDWLLFLVIFVSIFSFTPLLVIAGVTIDTSFLISGLTALVLAAAVVRWPAVGFYAVASCALLVEQFNVPGAFVTGDDLYVFSWPSSLQGSIERPIGFFIIFVFLVFIFHRLLARRRILRGGELLPPFILYLLCVAGGIIHGLMSGGNLKITVDEVRPFWYLFESYLLAYNLVTHKNQIRAFFWLVILSAGFKSLQGLYIYIVLLQGVFAGHNEIMAHEESFFFVALLLLLMLFCLFYRYRAQLYATLLIAPGMIVVLIANQRRADYLALLVGIAVAWVLIFLVKPRARKLIAVTALITLVFGGGYVAIFAHSDGGIALPARAIVSVFIPDQSDARDANSNQYRVNEDYDLKYTEKQNPLLGVGFGKQFLQPISLPDISAKDPIYLYVPHNTIYWIWMRLGPLGFFALWYLLGSIIVRGSLIVRQLRDPYLQLVAIYIVAVTFMEVIVAFADYQLYFYRNVIYLGLLAGILMRLPALDNKKGKVLDDCTTLEVYND